MSNNQWDELDEYGDQGEGPKALRDALKKEQRERKQLEEQLASLQSQSRERTLKEVLSSNGVNPAIAKFVPNDVSDEASVNTWLAENASIFNITLGSSSAEAPAQTGNPLDLTGTVTPPSMPISQQYIDAATTINQASNGAVPMTSEAQVLAAIQNASSTEELTRLLNS
jgi:hypothetical protein